ncbi:MAG: gliding motility-associated C-terminal domain-containing protein [Bacteroidota bacterium]
MKPNRSRCLIPAAMPLRFMLLSLLLGTVLFGYSQVNLVPNHSFEDIDNCDLNFGSIPQAPPWQIVPEPVNSPDLFHYCSTSGVYQPPAGCNMIEPKEGEGMIAQAHLIPSEERVYVHLTDTLPLHKDIYVSFSTITEAKCGIPPIFLCYTNTQCLAFSDFAFQNLNVALQSDEIISNSTDWTTLRTCYRANGTEDFVLLGNYRLIQDTSVDCDTIDDFRNLAYYFYDEIIVSPFEVVPDTLVICGDEVLQVDASFYDLPISWSDGVQGAIRDISEGGQLIARGRAGNCFLQDTTFIVKIPDEEEVIPSAICDGEELLLQSPITAVWPNGDTSTTYRVTEAGMYQARLVTDCDERLRFYLFDVADKDCDITYFVPNAFSPNRDGLNDQLDFFFESDFNFSGQLYVLDRWGSLLFQQTVNQANAPARWDGTFRGNPLGAGVYVWAYEYTSGKDGKTRVIYGDVALLL